MEYGNDRIDLERTGGETWVHLNHSIANSIDCVQTLDKKLKRQRKVDFFHLFNFYQESARRLDQHHLSPNVLINLMLPKPII